MRWGLRSILQDSVYAQGRKFKMAKTGVLVAAERAGEGSGGMIPDSVRDDAGGGAVTPEGIGDGCAHPASPRN